MVQKAQENTVDTKKNELNLKGDEIGVGFGTLPRESQGVISILNSRAIPRQVSTRCNNWTDD